MLFIKSSVKTVMHQLYVYQTKKTIENKSHKTQKNIKNIRTHPNILSSAITVKI